MKPVPIHFAAGILMGLLFACKPSHTLVGKNDNGSFYQVRFHQGSRQDSAILEGILHVEDGDAVLKSGVARAVLVDGRRVPTDSKGRFKVVLAEGGHRIGVGAIGFGKMEIEKVMVKGGDSLLAYFTLFVEPIVFEDTIVAPYKTIPNQ